MPHIHDSPALVISPQFVKTVSGLLSRLKRCVLSSL